MISPVDVLSLATSSLSGSQIRPQTPVTKPNSAGSLETQLARDGDCGRILAEKRANEADENTMHLLYVLSIHQIFIIDGYKIMVNA